MEMNPILEQALEANILEVREVPPKVSNEEVDQLPKENQPFLYSSGNWGGGYATIKSLVATLWILYGLITELTQRIAQRSKKPLDFVAGNVTGGVIPGWIISNLLEKIYYRPVQFIYVGGTRKGTDAKITLINKVILYDVIRKLAIIIQKSGIKFNFVAGMTPSGMVPGFYLSQILGVPFVYIRESRKKGGQQELITGPKANPSIHQGSSGLVIGQLNNFLETSGIGCEILVSEGYEGINTAKLDGVEEIKGLSEIEFPFTKTTLPGSIGLDVEELVNFAQTTVNSTLALRELGLSVEMAATILFYDNPVAKRQLAENAIEMVYLLTMADLLETAEKTGKFSAKALADYRNFLKSPLAWQADRGLTPVKRGGTL